MNSAYLASGEAAFITGQVFRVAGGPIGRYLSYPVDDPRQRRPDITRARTKLGWEPRVGLEEGLQKTLDYFRTVV